MLLRVEYEVYHNDSNRNNFEKSFKDLNELEEWIFGSMKQGYEGNMWFCAEGLEEGTALPGLNEPKRIEFMPEPGTTYWIHEIFEDSYIIFSDGMYTAGLTYWSGTVKEWLIHCRYRQYNPVFNFANNAKEKGENVADPSVANILKETRKLSQGDRLSLLCKVMEDALCDPEATRDDIEDDDIIDMYDSMQSMYEAIGDYLSRA